MGRLTDRVRDMYAHFMRGDTAYILDNLREDVKWDADLNDHGIPWLKERHGREGVAEFFRALSGLDFKKFEPRDFIEEGDKVIATVFVEALNKKTGKSINELELHMFTFDNDGQLTAFRHFVDTHEHMIAAGVESSAKETRKRAA